MEKINIAELLKDCPSGMELDCTMYDNVTLDRVDIDDTYSIRITTKSGFSTRLTKYGQNVDVEDAKCVIFPKGKTTWEGFVPSCNFKDGDIVNIILGGRLWYGIYKKEHDQDLYCHVSYSTVTESLYHSDTNNLCSVDNITDIRLATEEEKDKLFRVIKDNGYQWNAETKTLEELTESKFKDGDIVFSGNDLISIFKRLSPSKSLHSYVSMRYNGSVYADGDCWTSQNLRLATEEEKEKLFKAISNNGYKWDPDTKTLLTVPIFKAGDRIKRKDSPAVHAIKMIDTDLYIFDDLRSIPICVQGDYELVPNKFDIATLKPFSEVLVRYDNDNPWMIAHFSHYTKDAEWEYPYFASGACFKQCIPYKGNEHLRGTKNDCDDFYKTWK